jgi:hypothetical protein
MNIHTHIRLQSPSVVLIAEGTLPDPPPSQANQFVAR